MSGQTAWAIYCLLVGVTVAYAGYQAMINHSKLWAILFCTFMANMFMDTMYQRHDSLAKAFFRGLFDGDVK